MELFDFLNSINQTKAAYMSMDSYPMEFAENEKLYNSYVINLCLARNKDCLLYVNEMNLRSHLDSKLQFEFYRNVIPKRKRYSKKVSSEKIEHIDLICDYYKVNRNVAKSYLRFLSQETINDIIKRSDTGGLVKNLRKIK